MARVTKTFQAYVENKAGWGFKDAIVAIRQVSEASQKTFESEDCKGNYVESVNSHIISYSANFWMDKATQVADKPTMPLFTKVDTDEGEEQQYTDIFNVDVTHAQSIQVLNSNAPSDDKIFTLIELDLVRRFKV